MGHGTLGLGNSMRQFLKCSDFSHPCLSIHHLCTYYYVFICLSVYLLSICVLSIHSSTHYLSVCLSICLPLHLLLALLLWGALATTHTHTAKGPSQVPAVTGSGLPGTESTRGGRGFVLVWPHLGSAAFPAPGPQKALDPDLLRPAILTLRVLPRLHASCPHLCT